MSTNHILQRSGKMMLFIVMVLWLAACSRGTSTDTPAASAAAAGQAAPSQGGQFGGAPFESSYLTNTYESALPTTMQLVLGTLKLEEGTEAVTPEEAGKLLPLWQAVQGGTITNGAERNALYKSIESSMDAAQLQAIAAMKLTFTDMSDWASANGIEMPQGSQFGQGRQNGGGANSPFAALTDDQRAQLRNLSPEERQARLKEWGIEIPQGGFGGGNNGNGGNGGGAQGNGGNGTGNPGRGGGRANVLIAPLIELLTARAAE